MHPWPDHNTIVGALQQRGLARSAAERMAREWLDHCEDVALEARRAGVPCAQARSEACARLGPLSLLLDHCTALPEVAARRARREAVAVVARWGGAGVGGLATTWVMLAVMVALITP